MFDPHTSPITIHHRPCNRNTYITITHEGEVCVRTPIKEAQHVRHLLEERAEWIRSKLALIRNRPSSAHVLGKTVQFRGEILSVEQLPQLHKNIEKVKNNINIEKYYHRFYKDEALATLPSRVNHYARKMGLYPQELRYKRMRRRWGSCSSTGVVTFNTLMMQLSYEHIDYIIVHELAHLKHMNHSKAFHALVRSVLGNEQELRKAIKTIGMC